MTTLLKFQHEAVETETSRRIGLVLVAEAVSSFTSAAVAAWRGRRDHGPTGDATIRGLSGSPFEYGMREQRELTGARSRSVINRHGILDRERCNQAATRQPLRGAV
jgi:hypothetical protein